MVGVVLVRRLLKRFGGEWSEWFGKEIVEEVWGRVVGVVLVRRLLKRLGGEWSEWYR